MLSVSPGGGSRISLTSSPLAIRPTYGTASLPYDPMNSIFNSPSSLAIAPSSLPLLLTTVKNEGGSVTESIFPSPVPVSNSTFDATIQGLFGTDRANAIITSPYYILKPDSSPNSDEFREVFERLVTDGTWRCANRDAARHWVAAGGKVWMGEFRQGATYPDNQVNGGYCEVPGRVCHEVSLGGSLRSIAKGITG